MDALLGAVLLASCLTSSTADFDVIAPHDVTGTWRHSVTLPCAYSAEDHTPQRVIWLFEGRRLFERDDAGDHVSVTRYRGRVSLPQDSQGSNVSLTIVNLEIDDGGVYTCKVSLRSPGTSSLITKEAITQLQVIKVAVTKPVVQPAGSLFEVSPGNTLRFTCSAEGSPPITYRWYKRGAEGTSDLLPTSGSSFIIESAQTSHSGDYYCEVENRIPAKTTQQSQVFQLSITDAAVSTTTNPQIGIGSTERMTTTENSQSTREGEHHSTSAPSSTKDKSGRHTSHSTEVPKIMIITTKTAGKTECAQTTDTTESHTSAAPGVSSGSTLLLIIMVIVVSLALLVILVALIVTRCKRRKGAVGIYEIPTMSELNARANQNAPIVNVCQVNINPINDFGNGSCPSSEMPTPRKQNDYQPVVTSDDQKPTSDCQGAQANWENEYEKLLSER
ncbi:V-set and immunoglobulin domain-containing protein 4-like [Lissotriton helveticus]